MKLKKEFHDKLVELRIVRKFYRNVKNVASPFGRSTEKVTIEFLNTKHNFRGVILDAFDWSLSPEGHDYWHNIKMQAIEREW